ncbi:MAG: serine/threonine-protein kinase [Myxococcota bacterium]
MERFGRYRLLRKLAAGGMAEVHLASYAGPEGFEKHVAIKRLLPELVEEEGFVEMFLDEARLAARFNHPNIVQIFDLGEVAGSYFVAMEYVQGASLARLLRECERRSEHVPVAIAAKIVSETCSGLEYAHTFTLPDGAALSLVHRDVSSHNVLLSDDGSVKLLDFGIAKATTNQHRTRTTSLKGKLAYMSPEQIQQNARLDRRSDLFSLGIVLFELLTGRRPFVSNTDVGVLTAVVNEPTPDPRSLVPDLPESMSAIVFRALQKDRSRRYQSAREMQTDLQRFLLEQGAVVDSYVLADFVRQLVPPPKPEAAPSSPLTNDTVVGELPADDGMQGAPSHAAEDQPAPTVRVQRPPAQSLRRALALAGALLLVGIGATATLIARGPESTTSSVPVHVPVQVQVPQPPIAVSAAAPAQQLPAATSNDTSPTPPKSQANARTPAEGVGWLDVITNPWTEVEVNGRSRGTTPLGKPLALVPGVYKLRLVNPQADLSYTTDVRIRAGRNEKIHKSFATGTLTVLATPFGDVFVDGKHRGLTPLDEPVVLYEGTHTVRVFCEATGKSETRTVRIKPGRTVELKVTLN